MTTPSSNKPIPDVPASVADANAAKAPTQFQWKKVIELGYVEDTDGGGCAANVEDGEQICFHCGKAANEAESSKLSKCARCQVASYWYDTLLFIRNIIIFVAFVNSYSLLFSSFFLIFIQLT